MELDSYLLDTNIVVDALSANILNKLFIPQFKVLRIVLLEEIKKQIKDFNINSNNILNETYEEITEAFNLSKTKKNISYYDALNLVVASKRKMILVTGDQFLIKNANEFGVTCFGTIKLFKLLLENNYINITECETSLRKLKEDKKRRIPEKLIDMFLEELNKEKIH